MSQTQTGAGWGADLRTFALAAVLGLGGLAVGYLVVLVVELALIATGAVSYPPGTVVSIVLSTVLLQGVSFFSIAYLYARYRGAVDRFVTFHVPSLRQWLLALGGWVLSLVALVVIGYALQSSGLPTASNEVATQGMAHPEALLALIPLAFILVGPGEELLFRGVVQGTLRERFGAVPAVLLASLIFASAHFLSLTGSLEGRVVTIGALFCISLVLGGLYEYTGNLTVPALVHGAYDATQFAVLYVSVTSGATGGTGAVGWLVGSLAGVLPAHAGALAALCALVH